MSDKKRYQISDFLLNKIIENAYSKGRLSMAIEKPYNEGLSECIEFIKSVISC